MGERRGERAGNTAAPRGARAAMCALWATAALGTACGGAPQVLWSVDTQSVAPTAPLFTPRAVAFGHARGVTLLERSGQVRCRFTDPGRVVATPRSDGERLFFGGHDQVFYAIDFDCRVLWRRVLGAPVEEAPEVVGDLVHVGSHDGHVYALAGATGEVAWTFPELPVVEASGAPSPVFVAAATPAGRAARPRHARAHGARHRGAAPSILAAMPGIEVAPSAPSPSPAGGFGRATPVAVGGALFAVCDDHVIYALDAASGAPIGHHDLGAQAIGPPIMMNGLVVVATAAGEVRAISRDSLELAWSAPLAAQPGSVPHLLRSAIALFTADQRLVGLDPVTGAQSWVAPTPQPAGGSAEFFGPWTLTYQPGAHRGIVAADNRSGKVVWRMATRGDLAAHVGREGRQLWVLAGDGTVTCLRLPELRA